MSIIRMVIYYKALTGSPFSIYPLSFSVLTLITVQFDPEADFECTIQCLLSIRLALPPTDPPSQTLPP